MHNRVSLLRLMLLAPMLLAMMACVQSPPISAPTAPCSSLLPDSWREPVKHAAVPAADGDPLALLKAWIGFGAAEAGQLEKATGRTTDTIGIIERCESRDLEAVKKAKRRGGSF